MCSGMSSLVKSINVISMHYASGMMQKGLFWPIDAKGFIIPRESTHVMAEARMSRRMRKILRQIHKSTTHYKLQEIASTIQAEVDSRHLTYDDALTLGNQIQAKADTIPGDTIVYAISDRDAYRKTLELYLKDSILTRTEQLLLWEERRRLGIPDSIHDTLMKQLIAQWRRQGKKVDVHRFSMPSNRGGAADES